MDVVLLSNIGTALATTWIFLCAAWVIRHRSNYNWKVIIFGTLLAIYELFQFAMHGSIIDHQLAHPESHTEIGMQFTLIRFLFGDFILSLAAYLNVLNTVQTTRISKE